MENIYEQAGQQEKKPLADLQHFFAKSKVSISILITESSPFLYSLNYNNVLSEEELLELLGSSKSGHHIVYDCLCRIEENKFPLKYFFAQLFTNHNLKKYSGLRPIYDEYSSKRYRNRSQVTADIKTDPIIFAQDKVKICIAITDIFPFVHGLQDLGILSETESLKLQADNRPVSRVIYECLSLIEKKDFTLSIVFEYIFQECYLRIYPGLQDILQEPNAEHVEMLQRQHPVQLQTFLKKNKDDICQAISDRFPFLHGLHDIGMLSRLQLLRLQADKRATKEVLYKALSLIEQRNDLETFFTYLSWDFFLTQFPNLKVILLRIHEAIITDTFPPLEEPPSAERTAAYPKHIQPNVSTAPQDALYKSPLFTTHPEKRPQTAESVGKHKRKKIHKCDYEGCHKGFSDRGELKVHRKRHEGQEKVNRHVRGR